MLFRFRYKLDLFLTVASVASLNVPNDLSCHDPSRVIEDNGAYYFYCTSSLISGWYAIDQGNSWHSTPNVLANGIPNAVQDACPKNDGVWAPDVIWNANTKLFHIYYSIANWDNSELSAIGLVTSPTLNPSTAQWKSQGVVISKTPEIKTYAAIDPGPFFGANGDMWLSFGSGYGSTIRNTGISIIQLDKITGLRSGSSRKNVQGGASEASYVHYRKNFYYLFWNTGGCCDGSASTYTIHVARSNNASGPYTESRIFDESNETMHGPGQIGILTNDGVDYYSYHYYKNGGGQGAVLGFNRLGWSSDEWPIAST